MPTIWSHLTAEPLLTREEETALALQIEAGLLAAERRNRADGFCDATAEELSALEEHGRQARQRFLSANLRLVAMVSRPAAARSGLSEMDLFQEGCLGLLRAVEKFDCRRGLRFSTYALFWIRAFVGAATANRLGAMNLPTGRAELLRAVRGAEAAMAQRLGRDATAAEVAAYLGRSESLVAELRAHEQPQTVEQLDSLTDTAAADDPAADLIDDASRRLARDLLRRLPDLERDVMLVRAGFTGKRRSYVDTARVLGVSVARVRRAEARALDRLRGMCPQSAAVHLT